MRECGANEEIVMNMDIWRTKISAAYLLKIKKKIYYVTIIFKITFKKKNL